MEPSEEISVPVNPSEQHQGDADLVPHHSPSSPNANPDPATSDLEPAGAAEDTGGLHDELRSLDLKEREEAPRSDSEDKEEEGEKEGDLGGGENDWIGEIGNQEEADKAENDWIGEIGNQDEAEKAENDWIGEIGENDWIGEIGNQGEAEKAENHWSDNGEKGEENENKNGNETENDDGVNNGGGEAEAEKNGGGGRKYQYPVRPEAEDCSFYLKTGNCKFGSNCKFNHPVRRKNNQASKEKAKEWEESTEKPGQSECKYYLRSGGCKFGKACKYNHSRGKTSVAPAAELNFVGLPIRVGEKECPYYMRTGSCKYGTNCRFNHPDPTDAAGETSAGFGNGGPVPFQGAAQSTIPSWSAPRHPLNEPAPAPFVPMMIPPNQGVPSQSAEWNGYQAPVYLPDRNLPPPLAYVMNNPATETNNYPHHAQKQVDEYPERPGQPECNYFLKTGDCKFKSNCKYHHPKKRTSVSPPCALSDKGLPLRPDQNACTYYSRYGICKFGPGCKYDHSVQPNSAVSGVENQPPYSSSATMEGSGIARSGNRSETTIQQLV
ncbi:zinc finger CCCH domain-containing protein 43 [Morus notabilis]|uniref:zinc finger CCCH domain-containing protein 43 n=1 Tax=Morus notabilis TaxID=981085 RepID=UPI000CED0FB1|nr:zinc finger CCCH domain-containing protein 43 [Morus notabilis]